jgi:putative transposase
MKQTIIYKLNPTKEQESHLHNLCSIATKLYNTDNYQRRQEWDKTGKIPSVYTQKKLLKDNHWFKLLPSQTAQEVSFTLQRNYNSWFKLRKKDKKARPPMFRKKEMLSPITFYQQFKIIKDKIKLSVSRKYKQEKGIKSIEMEFDLWKENKGTAKMCQIIFKKGEWFAHIIYEITEPKINFNNKVMAIDVGVINTAVTRDNQGNSTIYKGGELLSVQRYYNKTIGKLQSTLTKQFPKRHSSKTLRKLNKKRNNQMTQIIHTISKKIVNEAKKNNVKTIVIGDITDIRKDKHWRKKSSQKLHSWSFSKLTQQIEYKAVLSGIRFVRVNEKYTSQTCSCCGTIRKNNRIKRGLYRCKICGRIQNADVNGATNILKKYLQFFPMENRSSGCVTQPKVSLIKNVLSR